MPRGRAYLPYGLTVAERKSPKLRQKLASCIRKVERQACPKSAKKNSKYVYRLCKVNPVATCRASLKRKLK